MQLAFMSSDANPLVSIHCLAAADALVLPFHKGDQMGPSNPSPIPNLGPSHPNPNPNLNPNPNPNLNPTPTPNPNQAAPRSSGSSSQQPSIYRWMVVSGEP